MSTKRILSFVLAFAMVLSVLMSLVSCDEFLNDMLADFEETTQAPLISDEKATKDEETTEYEESTDEETISQETIHVDTTTEETTEIEMMTAITEEAGAKTFSITILLGTMIDKVKGDGIEDLRARCTQTTSP